MYMNKEKVIYVGPSLSRGRLSHGRILIGGLPPELKRSGTFSCRWESMRKPAKKSVKKVAQWLSIIEKRRRYNP